MDEIKFTHPPIVIGVHEGIRLVVKQQDGPDVTYEIVQPGFAQDDGMGGNIVITCIAQGTRQEPETLSFIGSPHIHGDFGEGRDTTEGKGEFYDEPDKDGNDGPVVGFWGAPFVRIAPTTF